jgi:predicted transcriptional regulator with HTH domain
MIKILTLFLAFSVNSFASSSCQDLASLVSIFKLKDTITYKAEQINSENESRRGSRSPFVHKGLCEDEDINNNLKYMQISNYSKKCKEADHLESLDLRGSSNLAEALEERYSGHEFRCSSQQQEQIETYLTRLVRRVNSKFSDTEGSTKDICNTVRKALTKLSSLERSCSES